MSNIKSEALAQEFLKERVLKSCSKLTGKQLCAGVSFIIKVQADSTKPNFYVHIIPGTDTFLMKFAKFLGTPLRMPIIL